MENSPHKTGATLCLLQICKNKHSSVLIMQNLGDYSGDYFGDWTYKLLYIYSYSYSLLFLIFQRVSDLLKFMQIHANSKNTDLKSPAHKACGFESRQPHMPCISMGTRFFVCIKKAPFSGAWGLFWGLLGFFLLCGVNHIHQRIGRTFIRLPENVSINIQCG